VAPGSGSFFDVSAKIRSLLNKKRFSTFAQAAMVPSTIRIEFTVSEVSGEYGFLQLYIIVSKANMVKVFFKANYSF